MHVSNRKTLIDGVRSRSITYQSRMSYLKSREGDSGRRLLGKRGEKTSNSLTLGALLKPCPADKLLPPMKLMTKEKSFRHLYRKYHPPPPQIYKMNFLERKEDPGIRKKRDKIYAKIRASELASEHLKREKEAWQNRRNDDRKISSDISVGNSSSEYSSNEVSQEKTAETISRRSRDNGSFINNGLVVSGFVTEKDYSSAMSCSNNSRSEGVNDDNDKYGECFSFLAEWKKENKGGHRQKRVKQN